MGLVSSSREEVVTVVADGDFDFADIRDIFSAIYSSHEGSELLLVLIDDRASNFNPDTPTLRRVVDLWSGLSAEVPSRIALLATREVHFGFGRMMHAFSENRPLQFAVFSDDTKALAWLRREETAS